MPGRRDKPLVVADVGGTWARVGLAELDPLEPGILAVRAVEQYPAAQFSHLSGVIDQFVMTHAVRRPYSAVIACAGVVIDGSIISETLPWRVDLRSLGRVLATDDLQVVNDFVALAYATPAMQAADGEWLCGSAGACGAGSALVIGADTGLGTAVHVGGDGAGTVLASEMGQTDLAVGTARERALLEVLAASYERVTYENVLSGPGLINLYEAIASLHGRDAVFTAPDDIARAARLRQDGDAAEAVGVFCSLLGSYAGNAALAFMPTGGVYVTGSVVETLRAQLAPNHFVDRFVGKGQMATFLQRVPVKVVERGAYGLLGAARWYAHNRPGTASDAPGATADHRSVGQAER